MGKYVLKRFLTFIPMTLLMSFLIYGGLELVPGDILNTMFPPDILAQMSPAELDVIRASYGLDQPFIVRYFRWLFRVFQGDWGKSMASGVPVKDVIAQRLPITLELALTGLVISAILGSVLGILAALHKGEVIDMILTAIGVVGQAIPQFFFGMVAILIFALKLKWLPIGGRTTPQMTHWYEHLRYLILPAMVLGLTQTSSVMRYARSSMLESMNRDFVKTARSKGIPEWKVNLVHGFRVTMTPVIILIAFRLPALISTSMVIENVFSWPGIGMTFKDAVTAQNYPMVMMIALIIVVMVMLMSLLMDIFTRIIDPRVRLQ
ncbi:MAG: ABC transporter permease [Firmicutes bacterium]|nr:ABC transporter permease [Lachnospiraceae bacterium]MBQ1390731.1 ABC transporter permease [Bacillota bacterium]